MISLIIPSQSSHSDLKHGLLHWNYVSICVLLAIGRSACRVLPHGTLFQLGYGTHHWHSNSSSVC